MAKPKPRTHRPEPRATRGAPVSSNKSLPRNRAPGRGPEPGPVAPHGVARTPADVGDAGPPSKQIAQGKAVPRLPGDAGEPQPTPPPHPHAMPRGDVIPVSMGDPTILHEGPVVPAGGGARRAHLYPPHEPVPGRASDPSAPPEPELEDDTEELADVPEESIPAREQTDDPTFGPDSPGTQQDQ